MPNDTHFSLAWMGKLDSTGKSCSRWLKAGKTNCTFICTVCNTSELSCRNAGWGDIKKHFERPKHQQCMKDVFGSAQFIVSSTSSTATSSTNITSDVAVATAAPTSFLTINNKHERALTHEEKVQRAECIWAMTTARFGLSYNTSQFLPELMQSMFPDSNIAASLSMRPRKLSYVISHGTGHHFTMELIRDVCKAKAFSLLFDESTTAGVRKQCDLHFRYWSETKNGVCTRYYKSFFLGHATADIVTREIIDSLTSDGIDIACLLMLGRDNPNVNKAIENLIEKEVVAKRKKQKPGVSASGLMYIGSCPLHILHNSFRKGTTSTQWTIDESINEMWFWFSRSAARREDFITVANSIVEGYARFLHRFVCTRWIEIGMVLERVLEQWNIINEYFLVYLPKSDKTLGRNDRFDKITTTLKNKSTLARFHFILYLYRTIFKKALVWFQQERPLVHLLFGECCNVLRSVLLCFLKEDLVANKQGTQLLSISYDLQNSQRIDCKIDIGESTRHCLSELSNSEKTAFYKDVREIYCTITKELMRTLPINNTLLRHLQCLHPLLRKESASRTSILCIARSMPFLFNEDEVDRLGVEWRAYEMADIPDEWVENKNGDEDQSETTIYHPIDTYWHHVFSVKTSTGSPQFIVLTKLVKCLLSLSHGNADVERGFSENRHLLSDDRASLSEQSVNGLRATSAGVKFFADGKPHQVAITSSLLDNVKNAHSRYRIDQERQEQLRKDKATADQAAKSAKSQNELLAEQELDLLEQQKRLQVALNHATHLLEEGDQRLKAAIDAKNFCEIETAGILIDSGKRKLTNVNSEIAQNNDALNQLRKKTKK